MSFGFYPTHLWHLLALLVPVLLWRTWLSASRKQSITTFHNSSLAVSYWEEVLFRGLVWGAVVVLWHSQLLALTISSLLFGLFHLRNLWWAPRRQVAWNCLYTGLVFAPLVGLVRWWSGDIYLGIAIHALHNSISMYGVATSKVPTDSYLSSQRHRMNWFERLFSGWWR